MYICVFETYTKIHAHKCNEKTIVVSFEDERAKPTIIYTEDRETPRTHRPAKHASISHAFSVIFRHSKEFDEKKRIQLTKPNG